MGMSLFCDFGGVMGELQICEGQTARFVVRSKPDKPT
jgi:hypothetical protein